MSVESSAKLEFACAEFRGHILGQDELVTDMKIAYFYSTFRDLLLLLLTLRRAGHEAWVDIRSNIFGTCFLHISNTTYWSDHPTSLINSLYPADDELAQFLTEAKKMLREAQMVAEAVPNVDIDCCSGTRLHVSLYRIQVVLHSVDDPCINGMIQDVTRV